VREFRSLGSVRRAAREGGPYRQPGISVCDQGSCKPAYGSPRETMRTTGPAGRARPTDRTAGPLFDVAICFHCLVLSPGTTFTVILLPCHHISDWALFLT
jgi:hypothetical protein